MGNATSLSANDKQRDELVGMALDPDVLSSWPSIRPFLGCRRSYTKDIFYDLDQC